MADQNGTGPSEPYLPEIQRLYWIDTEILSPDDPEPRRPCVVIAVPETLYGTVSVVTRSTTDGIGVAHDRDPGLGLNKDGHFSRLAPVQCQLWTAEFVEPSGLVDEVTFSWVLLEFDK